MNLIVVLGPDTLGTKKYSSKESLRKDLSRIMKKKIKVTPTQKSAHLGYTFMGRKYCLSDLENAEIMTVSEYFQILCKV